MSNVRSAPAAGGEAVKRKPSAVVSRAQLVQWRGPVEKFLAIVVLLLGWLGTVVALHGSWAELFTAFSWGRAGLALLIQAALTFFQWAYGKVRPVAWPLRGIDAAFTAAGFAPLWMADLTAWLVAQGVVGGGTLGPWSFTFTALAAWALSWLACIAPAWYPETRLVQ